MTMKTDLKWMCFGPRKRFRGLFYPRDFLLLRVLEKMQDFFNSVVF